MSKPPKKPKPKPAISVPIGWGPNGPIYSHQHKPKPAPKPKPKPTTHKPTPNPGSGSASQDNAFDVLRDFFAGLGIQYNGEIEDVIKDAMLNGYGPDQIDLILPDLQKTNAFKNRFPGFQQRINNGYNAINIGDYLQLENQYHRIMQEAGLPAGFYDSPSDFGSWIAGDVSPDEIQNRVTKAVAKVKEIDPTARNLMAKFYGLATGDIASYFLDQSRALPVIERQYNASNVAAWAQRSGFDVNNISHYEDLVDKGVTTEQAASSYGTIKSVADTFGKLGSVYGETYTQSDAEGDVLFGQNDKRRRIAAQEAATFGGSSQGATGSAKRQSY